MLPPVLAVFDPCRHIAFVCMSCPQARRAGDDSAPRPRWVAEFVRFEGWSEGPGFLVCDGCGKDY